jgi:SAM-dependent methyltransferase
VSRASHNAPRHALDAELTPDLPGERVRAAMAAFYKHSEGYARQQGSHEARYFTRLIGVMEAVLTRPDSSILEIGAGSAGAMQTFLARRPRASAVALELSPASLVEAAGTGTRALRAVAGDALQLPFRSGSFDAVVCFEVVEHLPDVARALEEAARVVKRPGYVVIGLPNHASLWTPVEDRLRRRQRLAFGVDRGRGAWRWWKRNAALAWKKRLSPRAQFLYREPILHEASGGDADAVYYAAPVDLLKFFRERGARLVTTSARVRLGWAGRFLPVELQGSTVMAWRIS